LLFIFSSTSRFLTLILLTWRIWWAPNNARKWQMGFNSAFIHSYSNWLREQFGYFSLNEHAAHILFEKKKI